MEDGRMLYRSTKGTEEVYFGTALLAGQAKDRGLYMPARIPVLSPETIASMGKMSYPEIAFTVLNPFLEAEIPPKELKRMAKEAYDFALPLQKVYERKSILWLDKGPTLSFKDLAARMLSRLMQHYTKNEGRHITVLVATSGDTGSAVANSFRGLENITCIVLFPKNEVADLQRKQMTTLGQNITALSVKGKFDDCQALVKRAFADPELGPLNLSSANSINIGRLLPQLVQHFYAYARSADVQGEALAESVPCGNFGHITAGLFAKRMGLPIRFIAATNANDEFQRFLDTGSYTPHVPSIACISNAMNVGHPSNLARIVGLYGGIMDENGKILRMPDIASMRRDIFSVSVSDEETRATMIDVYKKHKIILDPHGAVAWAGLVRYLNRIEDWNPCVSFETADPGKFPNLIDRTLGVRPELPRALEALKDKDEHFTEISNRYEDFKAVIEHM
jgi:threonine synthase